MTLVLAIALSVLPFFDPTIPGVPVLLFIVPIGLCAVRFGVLGGLAASVVGVEVALVWFLQGQHFAEGLLGLSVQSVVFVLVGTLVGSIASEGRELEEALAQHHELSLDLMCTASFDGFFTKLNPAWTRVLGYERQELMSRPLLEFVHPDDVEPTKAELERQIEAGEPVLHFQNRYRHVDGSYRWLEWTSLPDDARREMVGVAREITDRKILEEAEARSKEALERAVRTRTRDLEQRSEELDALRRENLRRLALAAEYRDDQTFEHTERVGRTAAVLAQLLGASPHLVGIIRQAAPLHDIGKLGIPDAILLKPGKLTPEEFEQMKMHTSLGGVLLSGSTSEVLRIAEEIALTHHEWWDGSGYPNGLRGSAIPISGRVTALADVFDALTHERPYKAAWSVERAVDEIHRLSGVQFDPDVVAVFDQLDANDLATLAPEDPERRPDEPRGLVRVA